jgi:hypothetical protein
LPWCSCSFLNFSGCSTSRASFEQRRADMLKFLRSVVQKSVLTRS